MAIGEASPVYLVHPTAPGRIKHYIPDVRLMVILRDPAERAYSAYIMRRLYGDGLTMDFRSMIAHRRKQIQQQPVNPGFYYAHLKRYLDTFDPSQFKILLYEDFKTEPFRVLRSIFRFLGVDDTFSPDLSNRYMVGGMPKNRACGLLIRIIPIKAVLRPYVPSALRQRLGSYINSLQQQMLLKPPPLTPDVRRELIQLYREDILRLQDLIQRDLSQWLKE